MTLGVSKHVYRAPALKPPSLLLSYSLCNLNKTKSSDQILILHLFPPIFQLWLFTFHIKSQAFVLAASVNIFIKIMIKALSIPAVLTTALFQATKD